MNRGLATLVFGTALAIATFAETVTYDRTAYQALPLSLYSPKVEREVAPIRDKYMRLCRAGESTAGLVTAREAAAGGERNREHWSCKMGRPDMVPMTRDPMFYF